MITWLGWAVWAVASAAEPQEDAPGASARVSAEAAALRAEMAQDAGRSLWAGVDEAYVALVALHAPLTPADHLAGFEAARQMGRMAEGLERLQAALTLEPSPEVEGEIARIAAGWGAVQIEGSWRRPPRFVRERMPFGPDEQRSIEHARQEVEAAGSFRGLLPAGLYLVGDQELEVVAGGEPQRLDVRRPGRSGAVEAEEAERRGGGFQAMFRGPAWAGLALQVGPGMLVSPAGDAAALSVSPGQVMAPGAHLAAGVELGLGGIVAFAPSLSWDGAFGADVVANRGAAGLSLVLRPGAVRVEVGPTFGVVAQSGTGVTGTLDRQQDGDPRPNEALPYRGYAFGPGAAASVGWTVGHRGPFALQVVVAGGWQGGERDYVAASVGLGLAPWVERARR